LEALKGLSKSTLEKDIVLVGHDRGARICHRLSVDNDQHFENFYIRGVVLLDIIPTLVQWESFNNVKNSVSSFHWPLLANVDLATAMIMAHGGDVWCRKGIQRWSGHDPNGRIKAHQAIEVYSFFMKQEAVIRASCLDYRAGAEDDVELQRADQASNRRLAVETLVVYSNEYLASRYDVEGIWKQWSENHEKLHFYPIQDGVWHFLAEEGPQQTAAAINFFLTRLRLKETGNDEP
jgi:pimeloyl-ACP methyl ester carboxylesterase